MYQHICYMNSSDLFSKTLVVTASSYLTQPGLSINLVFISMQFLNRFQTYFQKAENSLEKFHGALLPLFRELGSVLAVSSVLNKSHKLDFLFKSNLIFLDTLQFSSQHHRTQKCLGINRIPEMPPSSSNQSSVDC